MCVDRLRHGAAQRGENTEGQGLCDPCPFSVAFPTLHGEISVRKLVCGPSSSPEGLHLAAVQQDVEHERQQRHAAQRQIQAVIARMRGHGA